MPKKNSKNEIVTSLFFFYDIEKQINKQTQKNRLTCVGTKKRSSTISKTECETILIIIKIINV